MPLWPALFSRYQVDSGLQLRRNEEKVERACTCMFPKICIRLNFRMLF